jgi:signal recognition particle GTPase
LDDARAVLTAASAFWRAPVQPKAVNPKSIEMLPLVNRVPNLEAALEGLLANQTRSWLRSGSRDKRYKLVVLAQLFGVGKTTSGEKLAEGLNAGVGGRLVYHW